MNKAVKKILFITGTRADFGKLKALILNAQENESYECLVFVTGMHMLSKYGRTISEIEKAGVKNIFGYINQDSSVNSQMDFVLGSTINGIGHYVREVRPDLIVVHGDRIEAMAGAIVGSLNNIFVAHIEGGEVSGTIDELIRHSVTKLSHFHFVANEEAKNRVQQMGETQESIFIIGSPDIDIMISPNLPSIHKVKERYAIPFHTYSIFMYHPVTTDLKNLAQYISSIKEAIVLSERNYVVIYPNNDHGSDIILSEILTLEGNPRIRLIPSLRFEYFLTLLKEADFIIGNSSAGIREAPVYGVPTINIGNRQLNRYDYYSILNVPENSDAILGAIQELPINVIPSDYFGKGESMKLFYETLQNSSFWLTPHQKQFKDA